LFEKDENFNEESIELFSQDGFKGYVDCTFMEGQTSEECTKISDVIYYYELQEIEGGIFGYLNLIDSRFPIKFPSGEDRYILLYAKYESLP